MSTYAPTTERLDVDLKATLANVYRLCPEWCDGTPHAEGDTLAHTCDFGSIEGVGVTVTQRIGLDGLPTRDVGVYIETSGTSLLDAGALDALVTALTDAGMLVARIRADQV
ncbi:MAG: hypothetical protein IPO93_04310 [Actinobacteria bacterium]|jgi:hypothetical protein|nr:hypothetical protein [Actinomycetota bacterium]